MEFDRRVRVRCVPAGGGRTSFGSGYLVGPRLVLTSAHVLDVDAGATVSIALPNDVDEYPAGECWRSAAGDAALVRVTAADWNPPDSLRDVVSRPPQRWGELIGSSPVAVTALGFPRMQRDPADGVRGGEQVTASISPGTGLGERWYEVSSLDPVLYRAAPDGVPGTPWSGMSGAPLLAGELLCGVICRDRQAVGGSRLRAVRAANLLADDAFRREIVADCGWEPALEPAEPAAILAPAVAEHGRRSIARLLRADVEAVAFHGRETELTRLRSWCESGDPDLSVRVLTGAGGQGKTRLARRLTTVMSGARSAGRRWVVGHVRSTWTDDNHQMVDWSVMATDRPLLLVIDYAETRPRLVRAVAGQLLRSRHRVRLLLVARADGTWRTDAYSADPGVREVLGMAIVMPLAALSSPVPEQFRQSAAGFARLLGGIPGMGQVDWTGLAATVHLGPDPGDARYRNALTLQMTALIALLQRGPHPVEAPAGQPVELTLLGHEQRFWRDSAKSHGFELDLPSPVLEVGVAIASLCGAATSAEARRVLKRADAELAARSGRVAAWLAQVYPAEPGRYWGSLQPDVVAEYHAARTLVGHELDLADLLAACTPPQQAQAITVLIRAATGHYNAARHDESRNLLTIIKSIPEEATVSVDALRAAAAALPERSHLTADLAVRIMIRIVAADRGPDVHEPALAASLSNLGKQLAVVGRRDEALAAEQETVEIYRRLADAYRPDLARSLANLGVHLSGVGRREEALAAEQEAVKIYRGLAAADPAAYESDLARSLANLGVQLSGVGRRDAALTAGEEAVEIYRRLTAANPAAGESHFARALANLGMHLTALGRRDEGATAMDQAVEIYSRLAAADPATHEADLAAALTNLGANLSESGRRDDGFAALDQAVKIYRPLAETNPAAYEPDLATALTNLSANLLAAGRWEQGNPVIGEAVETYRRLAAASPAVYEPDLAASLANLGMYLAALGRPADGSTAIGQAVEIYRRLTAANPAVFEPLLARLGLLPSLFGMPDPAEAEEHTFTPPSGDAAISGNLDELVTDPGFLLTADPAALLRQRHTVRTSAAHAACAAYELALDDWAAGPALLATSVGTHEYRGDRADDDRRRWWLHLWARKTRATRLAERAAERQGWPWSIAAAMWSGSSHRTLRVGSAALVSTTDVCALRTSDGRALLAGVRSSSIRLWDLESCEPLGSLRGGHDGEIYGVCAVPLPDGRTLLASGGADGTVRLWDPATGQPVGEPLRGHTRPVAYLGAVPALLASGGLGLDRSIRLWDPATGRSIGRPLKHASNVYAMCLVPMPDGRTLLASATGRTVQLWDPITSTTVGKPLVGHDSEVHALCAVRTPDGRTVLASAGYDKTVRLWDPATGHHLGRPLAGHTDRVEELCAVPTMDGRALLASASNDRTVRLWDLTTGEQDGAALADHQFGADAVCAALLPDGRTLVASPDYGDVLVWDSRIVERRGEPLAGHTDAVNAVCAVPVPDEPVLVASASDDGTVRLWDADDGRPRGAPLIGGSGSVHAVCAVASRSGILLATAGDDRMVRLWDPVTGRQVRSMAGHTRSVTALCGLPTAAGGVLLASASSDGTLRWWNPDDGQPVGEPLTAHTAVVNGLGVVPDAGGRTLLATGGNDGTVRLWDPDTFRQVAEIGSVSRVRAVCAVPTADGRTLLASGHDQFAVRLWDPATGYQDGKSLTGHTSGVTAVCTVREADGRVLLASTSHDLTLRLWDPNSGEQVGEPLTGHVQGIKAVCTVPAADGRALLVSAGNDRTIICWRQEASVS
jgi:WD40 repeat protein/tetratricopeptide (TPR) repeat protein